MWGCENLPISRARKRAKDDRFESQTRESDYFSRRQGVCKAPGMPSEADALAERLQHFAVRVLKFVRTLPRDPATDGVARQLARSGPGVSSNYRSARRARSRAEIIARLAVVL